MLKWKIQFKTKYRNFDPNADKFLYQKHNMPTDPITLISFFQKFDIPIVSLHKYLLEQLDKYSDQVLIECETNTSHGFYKLDIESRRVANALRDIGLKDGDIFGIIGQNSYEYLTLYLGAMIAGAVAFGIPSTDTYQEICDKLIQRNIKYLAISNKDISVAKKISEGIPITQKIIVFNGGSKLNEKFVLYTEIIDSYDPMTDDMMSIPSDPKHNDCLILNTSGCFTRPKPIVFTHYSVVSALEVTSYPMIFGYTQSEVVSSHCELSHQMAIFQIFTAITTGSRIALMSKFDEKDFVSYVKKFKISAAILTAQAVISLVKSAEDTPNFATEMKSLVKIISCGSVLSKTFANKLIDKFKHIKDLRQGLFHSECMAPITLMIKGSTEYESIGVPTPNTTVIIKDLQTGEHLGVNQIGEICVQRDDALCHRYLNDRNASDRLRDSDGWFHTRNLGYCDEERLLYAIGSVEEMIRSENTLIAPTELETLLLSHGAVSQASVIAVTDETLGQMSFGFVVLKSSLTAKVKDTDIAEFVNFQLPKRKKLNGVYIMKSMPKTICGKISKRKLREELCFKIIKQKF